MKFSALLLGSFAVANAIVTDESVCSDVCDKMVTEQSFSQGRTDTCRPLQSQLHHTDPKMGAKCFNLYSNALGISFCMDMCRDGEFNEPLQMHKFCPEITNPKLHPGTRTACLAGYGGVRAYAQKYVQDFLDSGGVIEEEVQADSNVDDVAEAARLAAAAQTAALKQKEAEEQAEALRIEAEAAKAEAAKIAEAQAEAARLVREENERAAAKVEEKQEEDEEQARAALLRAARERVEREFEAASSNEQKTPEDMM